MSQTVVQDGIIAGNYYNKYEAQNPVARFLMKGYLRALENLVELTGAREIHEIGCGEGYVSRFLARKGLAVRASDFSDQIVAIAKKAAATERLNIDFKISSIYDMDPSTDRAPLVLCCEVLEHLEDPNRALRVLHELARPHVIVSVPREPLWRLLNCLRGKYISDFGNTPGHLQHWSKRGFVNLLKSQFKILKVLSPTPWTFVLCESPHS